MPYQPLPCDIIPLNESQATCQEITAQAAGTHNTLASLSLTVPEILKDIMFVVVFMILVLGIIAVILAFLKSAVQPSPRKSDNIGLFTVSRGPGRPISKVK